MNSFWEQFKRELPRILVQGICAGITGAIGGYCYQKGSQWGASQPPSSPRLFIRK